MSYGEPTIEERASRAADALQEYQGGDFRGASWFSLHPGDQISVLQDCLTDLQHLFDTMDRETIAETVWGEEGSTWREMVRRASDMHDMEVDESEEGEEE